MKIMVNGEEHLIQGERTIADLVEALGFSEKPCAIERNRSVVPRAQHAQTELAEGDQIEIVTLVGGG
ncbi:MAG: thiamine biosynthesis protein ThiS [Phycisphaerae bacterium]|nr:thiamine biosynthesis protein ThiS [Phycisphaerae bacterium]HAW95104.1 thiamine biosynthesis protein ThiS [Phycisphaerales bacterium]